MLELLPQESEPYLTIHQMRRLKRKECRQMRDFVGLPSASVLFENMPSASVHSDLSWWLLRLQSGRVATIHLNQDWLVLAFAIDFGSCWSQQLGYQSLHQYLADPQKIPALIYCGIAHKFEYLSNQWSWLQGLHPALAHSRLLEFSLMKGFLEAMHPNPFVWLVCKFVCDLVHLLDCSLVAVIKSNEWPKIDF